jgi:hypothetical protein
VTARAYREDLPDLNRLRRERDGKVPTSWKPPDAGTHVPEYVGAAVTFLDTPAQIAARRRALLSD